MAGHLVKIVVTVKIFAIFIVGSLEWPQIIDHLKYCCLNCQDSIKYLDVFFFKYGELIFAACMALSRFCLNIDIYTLK